MTHNGYKSSVVLRAEQRERLDHFLARNFQGHSRSRLQRMIENGEVTVEGVAATKSGFELRPGWVVEMGEPQETPPHDLEPADIPLDVVFEDDDMLVVDKPRGLATHPARSLKEPSLVNALLARPHALSTGSAAYRPGIVHRLDKDTTGLLMVAKNDAAQLRLSSQIQDKSVERIYVANVAGEPLEDEFTVNAPIGRDPVNATRMTVKRTGKRAVTHVRRIAGHAESTLVACRLETGRTHQIRVHLAACHLPVLGDKLYALPAQRSGPLQLHAALLRFDHPVSGTRLTVFAPPPDDFQFASEVTEEVVASWN